MTAKYKAGIIGLGFIGAGDQVSGDAIGQNVANLDGTHLGALTGHSVIELVAGSSRDEGRRRRFEARTGTRTYAKWREMLDREAFDIVSVATTANVHSEIVWECACHGVRVIYCEKPIATRLHDADRMLAACEEQGTLLVINHNRRFAPNFRRLRDLIAADGLGELKGGRVQWPGGRLGNVGTHLFDAVRMLTGRKTVAVSGALDLSGRPDCRGAQFRDPGGWGMLRLEGGATIEVNARDYADVPAEIRIEGANACATVSGRGHAVELEYTDGRTDAWPAPPKTPTAMDRAVSEIVAWLDDGTSFPYPAQEAIDALETIVAFHVSHDRGHEWVELPLTGSARDCEVRSA